MKFADGAEVEPKAGKGKAAVRTVKIINSLAVVLQGSYTDPSDNRITQRTLQKLSQMPENWNRG